MPASAWIGPAIIAALVTGLLGLLRDWLQSRKSSREERKRTAVRDERRQKVSAALLAEIAAFEEAFVEQDLQRNSEEISARFAGDPNFKPVLFRQKWDFIYEQLVSDLGLLGPERLVPVVQFYGQLARVSTMIEDMRSDSFGRDLSVERKQAIYADYIGMVLRATQDACAAREALSDVIDKG